MTTYLLLHGFTGAPASFDGLVRCLPSSARVLRPAIVGHGPSPAPATTWDDEIARLARLLEVEGVEDAHLVGYSMGGRLGWGLLARSDRISGATLIGAHPGLDDATARVHRRAHDQRWIDRLEREGLAAFIEHWEALPIWRSQLAHEPAVLLRQRAIRESHDPMALAATLRTVGLAEMPRTDPAAIRVPVRLLVGEHDSRHRAIAERFALELPDADVSVAKGCGHNVLLEGLGSLVELVDP